MAQKLPLWTGFHKLWAFRVWSPRLCIWLLLLLSSCLWALLCLFLKSKAIKTVPKMMLIFRVCPGSYRGKKCFAHLKNWKELLGLRIYSNPWVLTCKILQMVLDIEIPTKVFERVYFSELHMCSWSFWSREPLVNVAGVWHSPWLKIHPWTALSVSNRSLLFWWVDKYLLYKFCMPGAVLGPWYSMISKISIVLATVKLRSADYTGRLGSVVF